MTPVAATSSAPDSAISEACPRSGVALANRVVLIIAITLAAYHNSFAGKMAFDDYRYLGEEKFSELDSLARQTIRPLLFWSLAANHWLGGTHAFGYHAFNLAVHMSAGLLLFGVTHRSLRSPVFSARFSAETARNIAFVVALLWCVHPLTTQAVTYLIQRAESMASMFYLGTLYGVARSAEARPRRVRWLWGTLAILSCWLGFGSKEIAASIPLSAAFYDRTFFASGWRDVFRQRGWVYLGQLSPLMWFGPRLLRYLFFSKGVSMGFGMEAITWWEYAYNQPAVILHYLRLVFWPHPLCLDYVWKPVERGVDAIIPCVIVLTLVGISLYGAVRLRPWGWVAATFFLILAPTSSFIPIADLAFEHRMYLPLAAVLALLVIGVHQILRQPRSVVAFKRWPMRLLPWFAGLLIILATLRTIHRNDDYADPERLWRGVIEVSPHNPRAHSNLGGLLVQKGDYRGAAAAFLQAVKLRPLDHNSVFGLAISLDQIGRHDDAIRCFQRGIELQPDSSLAYNDLGVSHERAGDLMQAEHAYRQALNYNSDFEVAAYNLGSLLLKLSRDQEAREYLELALSKNAARVATRRQLAWLLATSGDDRIRSPERAREILTSIPAGESTASTRVLDAWAAVHAAMGNFELAVAKIEEALQLARQTQSNELVSELIARQAMYRRQQPYVRTGT